MHVFNPLSIDHETQDTQTRHNRTVVQSIKIKNPIIPNALVALTAQNVPQPPPSEVSSSFLAVKCGMVCCSQVALRSSSILPRCMYCRCIRLQ